jgi:hypothetical protein
MGKIRPAKQVKLFAGIIASGEETLLAAEKELESKLGKISLRSGIIPFDHTDYYEAEMGGGLLRRWVGFEKTRLPSELAPAKVTTNAIEDKFTKNGGRRTGRRVNIDPGYAELAKVVLASTKDFGHRIYIGEGIYAELTLIYCKGEGYKGLPWTYPDYQGKEGGKFLSELRNQLKDEIDKSLPK